MISVKAPAGSHEELAWLPAMVCSGAGGFLRDSVRVSLVDTYWIIQHSIWELSVPEAAIDAHCVEFLQRKRPLHGFQVSSSEIAALLQLIVEQGCVTCDASRNGYAHSELRYVAHALISQWYGIYYSHAFWSKLTTRPLSLTQLFAWILRTYHLSRSVGATAARGAAYAPNRRIYDTFLKSSIEEYSHCDKYYFPRHEVFGLEERWIKELVALPTSIAFDQQMGLIAETDWLAHTFVAYFQEYTAGFRENAFELYDRLEADYGLHGFFAGWKEHIGFDVHHTHADDFEQLLSGEEVIPREQVLEAITKAATTVEYLIGSLDELLSVPADMPLREYRTSPSLLMDGATHTSLLGGRLPLRGLVEPRDHLGMCEALVGCLDYTRRQEMRRLLHIVLKSALTSTLVFALAHSADHDDILLLGKLLEQSNRAIDCAPVHAAAAPLPAVVMTANFLKASALRPADFTFLLLLALRVADAPAEERLAGIYAILADELRGRQPPPDLTQRHVSQGLQFLEICQRAAGWVSYIPPQDVLVSA